MSKPRESRNGFLIWIEENCYRASEDGCLLAPFGTGSHGYCSVSIKWSKTLAHRYVCEMFHGAPPTGAHQAAHACGRKTCLNPHHLRWATRAENEADKRRHGTAPIGEMNGAAKIDADTAKKIRASQCSNRAAAAEFGTSPSNVSRIRSGETWSHV